MSRFWNWYACIRVFGWTLSFFFIHPRQKWHSGTLSLSFICKICNYEAPYPARLQHHINSNHKNIKRFYCDICNVGYYWSNSLKKHYKSIHNEELSEDLSKYASESEKKKTYYVLPRPKPGKWIVLIERI